MRTDFFYSFVYTSSKFEHRELYMILALALVSKLNVMFLQQSLLNEWTAANTLGSAGPNLQAFQIQEIELVLA